MSNPIVEVSKLAKTFNGTPAVRDASFSVAPGETVALLGSLYQGYLIDDLLKPAQAKRSA